MLTIYRASAGAGKTHRLTGEYLRLLFQHPETAYRKILAVTFTNKATDEMKQRIIEELYAMSAGQKSDHLATLMQTFQKDEASIRREARQALTAILHDFSGFNISTIDRFFQQTMRAFARELGLQGGYAIEMDQEAVLTEATDAMLNNLERKENKALLHWLLSFSEEQIEATKGWSLNKDIHRLGSELFKENYQAAIQSDTPSENEKTTLQNYKKLLSEIRRTKQEALESLGEKGLDIIHRNGMETTDFAYAKTSPMRLFEEWKKGIFKAPSVRFAALPDDIDKWCTKASSPTTKGQAQRAYDDGLNDTIKEALIFFENLTDYHTASEILRNFYILGILTDLAKEIETRRKEKNTLLISDTSELLNKIIDNSDTPFIYEKTGTQIAHFMIDEFQDTSHMQWKNFCPLIGESMANDEDNLIVGDVKQSIYRFRNSDWELLDKQVSKDFRGQPLQDLTLKENWRSCKQIVHFNNALFQAAPRLLQDAYNEPLHDSSLPASSKEHYKQRIVEAYAASSQDVPPVFAEKDGHVRLEFLEETEEKKWEEAALDRLPSIVETLQDNGFALKDIAILVRRKKEGMKVANTLLAYAEEHPSTQYQYTILSDEALYASSSAAVRLLVQMLRYLQQPNSRIEEQMAGIAYNIMVGNTATFALPPTLKAQLLHISQQSLYETCEHLFRLFEDHFADEEQVFVQAFMDMVSDYAQRETPDISRFLGWWEASGKQQTIATPEGQDAIRILTVHKSKGLGFKAVIIPFADWETDHNTGVGSVTLWCKPQTTPFDQIHHVPLKYGKGLAQTHFAEDYFKERLLAFIDNLNTLYVALTRSKEELIILAPAPKTNKKGDREIPKITRISHLLWAFASKDKDSELLLEAGTWWKTQQKKKENKMEEIPMQRLSSISPDNRLELRLQGKNYFFHDTDRKHGTLLHNILSQIETTSDIHKTIAAALTAGVITREEASEIEHKLNTILQEPQARHWFDGSGKVLNESEILAGDGVSKRPDRVIIFPDKVCIVDYKFGARKSKRHQRQVEEYMDLVSQMGYKNVKGFLWYVELEVIEEV